MKRVCECCEKVWHSRFILPTVNINPYMAHFPYITLTISEIRLETPNTKSFVLRPDGPLPYLPGQFLTLVFPKADKEERRSYSISSNPHLGEPLTITVKRIDNGEYSRFLFDRCAVGDALLTIGATGFFTLPEYINGYHRYFFLAAGSGIAPILPIIKSLLHDHPSRKVFLLYSNRAADQTIFHLELVALEQTFPQFTVMFLFSSAQNLMKARVSKLMLQQYLKEHLPEEPDTALFYLCGPHDYMQMIAITLLTEGVPAANIRKENFSTVKPVVKELPPDQAPHRVTIHYDKKEYAITVQYPLTILETAKRAGIVLPYSCEAGKCGTCSATCLQGKVWLSYNEVLLDKELNAGRVLTCVGFPYGEEDVVLDFPPLH